MISAACARITEESQRASTASVWIARHGMAKGKGMASSDGWGGGDVMGWWEGAASKISRSEVTAHSPLPF